MRKKFITIFSLVFLFICFIGIKVEASYAGDLYVTIKDNLGNITYVDEQAFTVGVNLKVNKYSVSIGGQIFYHYQNSDYCKKFIGLSETPYSTSADISVGESIILSEDKAWSNITYYIVESIDVTDLTGKFFEFYYLNPSSTYNSDIVSGELFGYIQGVEFNNLKVQKNVTEIEYLDFYYNDTFVNTLYAFDGGGFNHNPIYISGGALATSSRFIKFFYDYAGEIKLTSLEGSTINVPSNWTASSSYGRFYFNGRGNTNDYPLSDGIYFYEDSTIDSFQVGYSGNFEGNFYPLSNSIWFGSLGIVGNSAKLKIEIYDGRDVSNQNLIQWFIDINAIIVGGVYQQLLPNYSVTFNCGKGDVNSSDEIISSLTEIPELPSCTREYYTFDGWYYDDSYTEKVYEGDPIYEDTVIYAKYICIITDLTNTTWELNNTVARLGQVEYSIQGSAVFEDAIYNCEFNSLVGRDQGNIAEDGDCEVLIILSTINDDYEDGFPGTFLNPNGRVIYNAYSDEANVVPTTLSKSSIGLSTITSITITGGTDATNDSLIEYVIDNFTEVKSYMISKGTYIANDEINLSGLVSPSSLSFTSNGASFTSMGSTGTGMYYGDTTVYYNTSDDGETFYWKWENENYKTIMILNDQIVDESYYNWFNLNYNFSSNNYCINFVVKYNGVELRQIDPITNVTEIPGNLPNPDEDDYLTFYDFKGWYLDEAFTSGITEGIQLGRDITLYAKLEPISYTLSFVTNTDLITLEPVVITPDTLMAITTLPVLSHDRIDFLGWYYEPIFETEVKEIDCLTKDTIIYAKIIKKYLLAYETGLEEFDSYKIDPIYTDKIVIPEWNHPTFGCEGWYHDVDRLNKVNEEESITEDTIIYAKVLQDSYNISFDSNGGTDVESITSTNIFSKEDEPIPYKNGYIFKGWFYDKHSWNEPVIYNDILTDHITLYAKWEKQTFNLVYTTDGSPVESSVIGFIPNPIPISIKDGYIFDGWYYDQEYTNKALPGDEINEDTTVYAKFRLSYNGVIDDITNGDSISMDTLEYILVFGAIAFILFKIIRRR